MRDLYGKQIEIGAGAVISTTEGPKRGVVMEINDSIVTVYTHEQQIRNVHFKNVVII